MRAAVVVLGDLGRSPRMLFHTRALAGEGWNVDLVGAGGTRLPAFIADDPRVTIHIIEDTARRGRRPSIFGKALRGLRLLVALTRRLLWLLPRPDLILVQNPPGVPTLGAAWLAARWRSARLALDWHNTTSAMLALRFGARHPIVRGVAWYEGVFGRMADVNLFVSGAMRDLLGTRHSIHGIVFRDHPADIFDPLGSEARERLRGGLFARFGGSARRQPALLISPTSWTADEHIDMLLDALQQYDDLVDHNDGRAPLPPVLALITGNGPLKQAFEDRVSRTPLAHVVVRTAWFEADEYPRTLAAADVGLSFHTSASGVDLPMKIADMFGAGIPVCAFDYGPCLQELVHPGVDGVLFTTANDCCAKLEELLRGFPASVTLPRLKAGAIQSARVKWSDAWRRDARSALVGT